MSGPCFAHALRATTLSCAVLRGTQWLEHGLREPVEEMNKRLTKVASVLEVGLPNPRYPSQRWLEPIGDVDNVPVGGILAFEDFFLLCSLLTL